MKLLLILGLAAIAAVANAHKDPCVCTREYMPVCGTDGKTYGNKCTLNCEKITKNHNLEIAHAGSCKKNIPELEDLSIQDPCVCTREYKPVCGTDGKTYGNKCTLNCEKSSNNHDLRIAHSGPCDKHRHEIENFALRLARGEHFRNRHCVCPFLWAPVCGTNGRTYPNECSLKCDQVVDKEVKIAHEGVCDGFSNYPENAHELEAVRNHCICTMEYNPVCGTDGKTYGNKCALNCAKRNNENLNLAHEGMCNEHLQAAQEAEHKHCACPFLWAPLCGTNGRTYPNECVFKCHQDEDKDVKVAHSGVCDGFPNIQENENEIETVRDPCICTREYMPVCGTDGQTYPNKCELNCEKVTKNQKLELAHEGTCDEQLQQAEKDPCICPFIYLPVCGTDGRTYPNECVFKCDNKENKEVQIAHEGRCSELSEVEEAEEDLLRMRDPCVCTREYRPVCGTNGKTYPNPCVLRCAAVHVSGLKQLHFGKCNEETEAAEMRDPCICTRIYMPVCGSDGKTYSNQCMLRCAASTNPQLQQVHTGECEQEAFEENFIELFRDPCVCNKMLRPVCGSDGRTYSNPCRLNCAKETVNHDLELVHYGSCDSKAFQEDEYEEIPNHMCACNRMLLPVCGSDGVTYNNPCLLKCAQRENHELTMVRYGPCLQNQMEELEQQPLCACNRMYFPVCGTDGITYANPCLLQCAQKNGKPALQVLHEGKCNHHEIINDKDCFCGKDYRPVCAREGDKLITFINVCRYSCAARDNPNLSFEKHSACNDDQAAKLHELTTACTLEFAPVCGTDGHTYGNLCFLKAAAKHNEGLTMAHKGACKQDNIIAEENQLCACPDNYNPVCGKDLHTYANMCEFNCAAKKKPGLELLYPMACIIMN